MGVTKEELKQLIDQAVSKHLAKLGVNGGGVVPAGEGKDVIKAFGEVVKELAQGASPLELEKKGLTEASPESGGVLVPCEVVPMILDASKRYGKIRNLATVFPVSAPSGAIPATSIIPPAYVVDEGQNIPEWDGQGAFHPVRFAVKIMGVIIPVSRALLQDSVVNLANFLIDKMGQAFARAEDVLSIMGNFVNDPKYQGFDGVLTQLKNAGVESAPVAGKLADLSNEDLSYDLLVEINTALDKVDADFASNAVWVVSPGVYEAILKIKDANGYPIFNRRPEGAFAGTLFGRPVIVLNHLRVADETSTDANGNTVVASHLLVGDLRQIVFFERQAIEMEVSTQAGNAFATHQVLFKAVKREDIKVALLEAFVGAKVKIQ